MHTQQFKTAVWSYKKQSKANDTFVFDSKDLDHTKQIFTKYEISPESLEKVTVDFIIQHEESGRYVIKQLDILLQVGGYFEVNIIDSKNHSSYFLSNDQVKYEFSVSTNGRYFLSEANKHGEILSLLYQKRTSCLPENDTILKWSFGIITNGEKLGSLNKLLNSIHDQHIPEYEIIICGPYPAQGQPIDYTNVIILPDIIYDNDIRFPIAAKKNRVIDAARYNNLCILHDRFKLSEGWYMNMMKYGNYFDYLCLPTLDKSGNRFGVDWMTFSFPLTQTLHINKSIDYHKWSPDVIIQGGVIIGKKHLILQHKLDERLHWEEMEDIHFSKAAYLNGAFFNIDINNSFISESVNHTPLSTSLIVKLKINIYSKLHFLKDYLKFKSLIRKYHKS